MPKIKASMADVSTDFSPIDPGVHMYEIEEVEENQVDGDVERIYYSIKSKVVEVMEDGNPSDVGRSITDRVHIHKKDGDINEFGVAQLKRYFEVCLGEEEANDPEADSDWLIGTRFLGQTVIRTYTVKDNLSRKSEERKTNEISRLAPV